MTCRPLVWLAPGVAIALFCARSIIIASAGKERSGGDATVFDEGPVPTGALWQTSIPTRWSQMRAGEGTFRRRMAAARPGGRRDCLFELPLSRWAGTGPGPRRP